MRHTRLVAQVCAQRELRLIPCQGKLQNPPITYRCEAIVEVEQE